MKSWEQDKIKAMAHSIWLQQGCPEGRALEHWHEAEALFLAQWLVDQEGAEHQVRDIRVRPSFH